MPETKPVVQVIQTYGEKAVGVSPKPTSNAAVNACKKEFAAVIDRMHNLRKETTSSEVKRLTAIAITESQAACMWAIRALTWQD